MALAIEHIEDCQHYLGKAYAAVHSFLDQYAHEFPIEHFVDYHRTFLHNSYGIAILKATFGEGGEKATLVHLYRDYFEGPITHLPLEVVLERARKSLIWWDKMQHGYSPQPHILRGWEGQSLCCLAFK